MATEIDLKVTLGGWSDPVLSARDVRLILNVLSDAISGVARVADAADNVPRHVFGPATVVRADGSRETTVRGEVARHDGWRNNPLGDWSVKVVRK